MFNKYLLSTEGEPRLIKEPLSYIIFYGTSVRIGDLYLEDNKDKMIDSNHSFAWYTLAFLYALFKDLEFSTIRSTEAIETVVEKIFDQLYYYVSKRSVPEEWKIEHVQIVFGESLNHWKEKYNAITPDAPFIIFHRLNVYWEEEEERRGGEEDEREREGKEFAFDVFTLDRSLKNFVPLKRKQNNNNNNDNDAIVIN